MDCAHPLIPHIMANMVKMMALMATAENGNREVRPRIRLAVEDMMSPVAMNRVILQWSERKPLTNLPMAYAQNRQRPMVPNWEALRIPLSMMGLLTTFREVRHT